MIDTHSDHKLTAPGESISNKIEEQEVARTTPLSSWSQRLWRSMKSYPLPLGALTLLLVSLLLWLVGRPELSHKEGIQQTVLLTGDNEGPCCDAFVRVKRCYVMRLCG